MDFEGLHPTTVAVTAGRPAGDGATLNPPIVLASNFRNGGEYVRSQGTETWAALERAIGALEGGEAVSFASGMAVASAILHVFSPRVLVLPTFSYQGVRQLAAELVSRGQLEVRFVDSTKNAEVLKAAEGADLVWLESATNPTLDQPDLPTILEVCRQRSVPTVVDATFATPLLQQPLKLGATVVMHSGTKFIGGHSDLLIGLAVTSDQEIRDRLFGARISIGATPGALEAYLALRGLRTLAIRLERSMENATDLAARLTNHARVESVRHFGAMVSFIVHGGAGAADAAIERLTLVVAATSLGGVETTMERRQKYAGDAHVAPGLIRMSVGIEHVEDIWADLAQALDSLR
jgi:cystathionine gamma-synthase